MRLTRKKVMIVEDETIFAMSLVELLGLWGYDVIKPVSSGEGAISTAEKEQPDIIIMDVGLKGPMDGIEAAARIREKLAVPVIFISGYEYEGMSERIGKVVPSVFLNKPLDTASLRANIERLLS